MNSVAEKEDIKIQNKNTCHMEVQVVSIIGFT